MAERDSTSARGQETVTITILRARNLRGQRSDTVNATVKVEYGDKLLGESPKVECTPENPAEFNFNSTLPVTFDDPMTLDDLACRPVVCTIVEVLPKERKQKEEKTVLLGQCSLDLLPLLTGETESRQTVSVSSLPGSPLENQANDSTKAELDVLLSVRETLLSEAQLSQCNIMSVTVESLYSLPEAWAVGGTQFAYTGVMPVPLATEKENLAVFAGGAFKPGPEKEVPNRQRKWAVPGAAQAGAAYIQNKCVATDGVEDEDGDYRGKEDREHRRVSEQEKNRVTWNIERRSYMDAAATAGFQEKIGKARYWPIEVSRLVTSSGGKGGKKDDDSVSFHGVAYVNLAPLLYPGVKRIRGAYIVRPFIESELADKTQRKGSHMEEALRIANGILTRNTGSPFPKHSKKEEKAQQPKKGVSGTKAADTSSDADGPLISAEGQQYVEAKTYITVEIALHRPLVPKRPAEQLANNVAEYIPPRPKFPKRTDGAKKALEDFHGQVGVVANLVLEEFRDQFGTSLASDDGGSNTPEAMEDRKQKLIYHLNSSGKYFAIKEQLKHAVVKIVREKFLKTTPFKDRDEVQTFLSELYVYLVDQMHVSLGHVLNIEDQSPIPEPLTDSAQLKHFAREAEVNENFELAARYYKERIARDRNDPDHWMDYGTFCLYINDLTKAEECFKECVSIHQRHIHGLLLYGVVCTMQDKHEVAETFFEAAASFEPESILAWTMLGLFYDGIGNEIGAEMALMEANKLNQDEAVVAAAGEQVEGFAEPEGRGQEPSAASQCPSQEPEIEADPTKVTPGPDQAKGRLRSGERLAASRASTTRGATPAAAKQTPAEDTHDQTPPPRQATPVPAQTIFMDAVNVLLEIKAIPFTERALAHHLLDPMGGPSALYHISLARLKMQKRDLEEAERALNEAVQVDNQSADAWALMGHVKYLLGDTGAAKHCYERTLAFVSDATEMHSIYLRLASIYLQEARFADAKRAFLMACRRSPSCVAWLGVGIACYRLGELTEAEDALSEANILNNTDPEVWAYLALVCLQTGRELEAEQAYKYSLKLNLQEEDLLLEIHQLQESFGIGNPAF